MLDIGGTTYTFSIQNSAFPLSLNPFQGFQTASHPLLQTQEESHPHSHAHEVHSINLGSEFANRTTLTFSPRLVFLLRNLFLPGFL
jgi:hypothetical protein